jgi:Ca2+-binding EF-hand superfamily protein
MILNVSYSSELIRRDLAAEELNYKEVFNFIDFSKGGLVTKDEMKGFLNKYNFHPFNEDLDNLMGRFDRNRSGKINFKEFEYELLPKLVEN